MTIEPTDPHTAQEPIYSFVLWDRVGHELLGRIQARQSTIDVLNRPAWMQSRQWKYVRESQCTLKFPDESSLLVLSK